MLGEAERVELEELGLPPGTSPPFRFLPGARESALLVSFPHVGLGWPDELPEPGGLDLRRFADFEVHSLFSWAPALGAACLLGVYSRLVVDLNRPRHEIPSPRGALGREDLRGAIWARAGGVSLLGPAPDPADLETRLERYYDPYHAAVAQLLGRRRDRFGYAILVDAHSMPGSIGLHVVLGTRGTTTCSASIAHTAFSALCTGVPRLRVTRDRPYAGGELVRRFGRPAESIHALQLELSRSLYMDETQLRLLSPSASPSLGDASPLTPGPPTPEDSPAALAVGPKALENRMRHLLSCLLVGVKP